MPVPQAIILAGGLGTRLGAETQGLPKPMVPVGERPFLEYLVEQLAGQGFQELLLLVGHRAEAIESHFGDGRARGLRISYSREPQPLGTGGALAFARERIGPRFLMMYGDLYRDVNYGAFCEGHRGHALAVYPYVPGLATIACANVGLDETGRRVARYVKGDPGAGLTHVDAGFGVFDRGVLDLLPLGVSSFEERVYPQLARQGSLEAHLVDRDFFDIGNPSDLAHARASLPPRFRN